MESPLAVVAAAVQPEGTFVWSVDFTRLLIDVYRDHMDKFTDVNFKKKMVWRLICEDIATNRPGKLCLSAVQCENKWKSLTAALRKVTDHNNTTGRDRKECAFYKELLDAVGRKANITPPCLGRQGKSATDNYSRRSSTSSSDDDSLQAVTVTPVTVGSQVTSSPGTPTATLLSAGNCSTSQGDVVPDGEEEVDDEPLKKKRKTSHRSEGKCDILRLTEALEKARAAHSLALAKK